MSAVLDYLPRGNTLSDGEWHRRHRILQWLLAGHIPALFIYGVARGYKPDDVIESLALPLACLIIGHLMRSRRLAASFITLGLVYCSAALVGLSDGAIEAHFHFFIIIGFIALYQDWVPFLLNILFTVLSHGIGSSFVPDLMFNHTSAQEHPWEWSVIHGLAVLAACVGVVLFWKNTEDEQNRSLTLTKQLADAEISRRRFTSDLLVNLARRNQNLLYRQLDLLNDLEEKERDPDALSDLFRLDHLATRIRRNAENLLVISGEESPRTWREPVPLADVVRAAIAEIEDLDRVDESVDETLAVSGRSVADLTHLFAELLENAVHFSPPGVTVVVRSRPLPSATGTHLVTIEDWGVGMTPDEMIRANEILREPREVDLSVSQRLGLHVVARLAQRYGVRVELTPTPGGGVTAVATLPSSIFDRSVELVGAAAGRVGIDEPTRRLGPGLDPALDAAHRLDRAPGAGNRLDPARYRPTYASNGTPAAHLNGATMDVRSFGAQPGQELRSAAGGPTVEAPRAGRPTPPLPPDPLGHPGSRREPVDTAVSRPESEADSLPQRNPGAGLPRHETAARAPDGSLPRRDPGEARARNHPPTPEPDPASAARASMGDPFGPPRPAVDHPAPGPAMSDPAGTPRPAVDHSAPGPDMGSPVGTLRPAMDYPTARADMGNPTQAARTDMGDPNRIVRADMGDPNRIARADMDDPARIARADIGDPTRSAGADPGSARTTTADFGNAPPPGADFGGARPAAADFGSARTTAANVDSARPAGADPGTARPAGADFDSARPAGADLGSARTAGVGTGEAGRTASGDGGRAVSPADSDEAIPAVGVDSGEAIPAVGVDSGEAIPGVRAGLGGSTASAAGPEFRASAAGGDGAAHAGAFGQDAPQAFGQDAPQAFGQDAPQAFGQDAPQAGAFGQGAPADGWSSWWTRSTPPSPDEPRADPQPELPEPRPAEQNGSAPVPLPEPRPPAEEGQLRRRVPQANLAAGLRRDNGAQPHDEAPVVRDPMAARNALSRFQAAQRAARDAVEGDRGEDPR